MRGRLAGMSGLLSLALAAGGAAAQTAPRPETDAARRDREIRDVPVDEREHVLYSPEGVRAGAFLIFPRLELRERYTDNLYYAPRAERSDFVTTVNPAVGVRSDFGRHELQAYASTEVVRHLRHERENVENHDFYLGGRLDVVRDAFVTARLTHTMSHESRSSPDDVAGLFPTGMDTTMLELAGEYRPARFLLAARVAAARLDFEDAVTSTGVIIDNDDRDRRVLDGAVRVGYLVFPGYVAFVEAVGNVRDYRLAADDNGFDRDSRGWGLHAGADLALTGKLRGHVFAGWMTQTRSDPALDDFSGWTAGAGLLWQATGLTTVRFDLSRTVEETTTAGAAGYVQTKLATRVDHELRRNIVVGAEFGYARNAFVGVDRDDDVLRGVLRGVYKFDKNFFAGIDGRYLERSSSMPGAGFAETSVMLTVGAQL